MIARASSSLRRRPASASTFASLWRRAISASSGSRAFTARTPASLFATMLTPVPEPHASTARSARPSETRPAASAACTG